MANTKVRVKADPFEPLFVPELLNSTGDRYFNFIQNRIDYGFEGYEPSYIDLFNHGKNYGKSDSSDCEIANRAQQESHETYLTNLWDTSKYRRKYNRDFNTTPASGYIGQMIRFTGGNMPIPPLLKGESYGATPFRNEMLLSIPNFNDYTRIMAHENYNSFFSGDNPLFFQIEEDRTAFSYFGNTADISGNHLDYMLGRDYDQVDFDLYKARLERVLTNEDYYPSLFQMTDYTENTLGFNPDKVEKLEGKSYREYYQCEDLTFLNPIQVRDQLPEISNPGDVVYFEDEGSLFTWDPNTNKWVYESFIEYVYSNLDYLSYEKLKSVKEHGYSSKAFMWASKYLPKFFIERALETI